MCEIFKYEDFYYDEWNNFVIQSNNGTIFHRLDFLDYHGEKFKENIHHLMWFKKNKLYAVMPMGLFNEQNTICAKSPIGASYGGLVTKLPLSYVESSSIVDSLIRYLKGLCVKKISITLPLRIVDKIYSDTLFFSFLERGFKIINSDISTIIPIQNQFNELEFLNKKNKEVERKARKALQSNVILKFHEPPERFWEILQINFKKFETGPTHSFDEWAFLCKKFPLSIWSDLAYIGDLPIAGIGHIKISNKIDCSFYICNDVRYKHTQALSYLLFNIIEEARQDGINWIDLGTSSYQMKGRENIFRFKESLGGTGCFRHTIELTLS